jgi:hypothetical protein
MPIHLIFNGNRALDIIEGPAPYGISTSERLTKTLLRRYKPVICKPNPITAALKYNQLYQQYGSMTAVGKELGVSRVRVHQMLNLLHLDDRIIEHLAQLTVPKEINYWTERKLRNLLKLSEKTQYIKFKEIALHKPIARNQPLGAPKRL